MKHNEQIQTANKTNTCTHHLLLLKLCAQNHSRVSKIQNTYHNIIVQQNLTNKYGYRSNEL